MVLDAIAAGKEDNDLLLEVTFEKREQKQEPLVCLTNHVSLFQPLHGTVFLAMVHVDVQRPRTQRYPSQVFDLGGLGG